MAGERIGYVKTAPRSVVMIIPGYGVELTSELINYLRRVAQTYRQLKSDGATVTVIVSGGATAKKSSPNETEAGVMKLHLARHGVLEKDICPEETAITTLENIKQAMEIIKQFKKTALTPPPEKIIVFCARNKKPAVYMALHYFSFQARRWFAGETEIKDFPLSAGSLLERLFGGLAMWFWIVFPKTHEWHKRKKMRKIENL